MFNSNLSFAEKERIAYISGDVKSASVYYEASAFEIEVDSFDDILEKEKLESFEAGKTEALGENTRQIIYDLERQLREANETIALQRKKLSGIFKLFFSDDAKTVAGRKKLAEPFRYY